MDVRLLLMRAKTSVIVALLAMLLLVIVGCSSAPAPSASSTGASSEAATSSTESSAASDSAENASSSGDFDRMIVGSWRIYEMESEKGLEVVDDKVNSGLMAELRKVGVYGTCTFFSDGTFEWNFGRGKKGNLAWKDAGYNKVTLFDAENDEETIDVTFASGKMTFEVDVDGYGKLKLIYSKQ